MSNFSSAMQTSDVKTENGAVTHSTSGTKTLDAFSRLPAMRASTDVQIWSTFSAALAEDETSALKVLFYLRDIRGGTGERKVFREILTKLASVKPQAVERNLHLIPVYGRWDDLFCLEKTQLSGVMYKFLADSLDQDIKNYQLGETVSLLCKWMPNEGSKNHSIYEGFCKFVGWRPKQYRKTITILRRHINVVEQKMCAGNWEGITFSHVSSYAMKNYTKAFYKHCPVAFADYIAQVKGGKTKINSSTLYPYDLVRNCGSETAEIQWNALPNYIKGDKKILPVVDVSGSMATPIGTGSVSCKDVAVSLGLYCSERQTGAFKNHLISFESKPKFTELRASDSFLGKVSAILGSASDMGSTNLQAVFELILSKAKAAKLPQEDMPDVVLILSDMEFNSCGGYTNAQAIDLQYQNAGYKLPMMAWWNIQSRNEQSPVKKDDRGNMLIAGCSPAIMKNVLSCDFKETTPLDLMRQVLDSERYSAVK